MAHPFNQFSHAGERYNDKVIVENFGSIFDREAGKRKRYGYLVVCKCGCGFIAKTYNSAKGNMHDGYKHLCPYCEGKLKRGE